MREGGREMREGERVGERERKRLVREMRER